MDVLPLVPVGLLVIVVSWLIWPVLSDALTRNVQHASNTHGDADATAETLFDVWSRHGTEPGLVRPERAA